MLALRAKTPARRGVPPSHLSVNYGHPSSSGLCNYWLFTTQKGLRGRTPDLVGNSDLIATGATTTLSYAAEGILSVADAGTDGFVPANVTRGFAPTDFLSWDCFLRWDASDTYGSVCTQGNSQGVYIKSTGKLNFYNGGDQLSTATLVAGNWYHLCITSTGVASGVKMYINGLLDTSGLALLTANPWAPSRFFNDTSSDTFSGICVFQRLWGRVLSATEVMNLYLDPWMLISKNSQGSVQTSSSSGGGGGTVFSQIFGAGFGGGGSLVTIAGGAN